MIHLKEKISVIKEEKKYKQKGKKDEKILSYKCWKLLLELKMNKLPVRMLAQY